MNKIDEIKKKLLAELWCDDTWEIVEEVIKIITPYLAHGITEEEARLLGEWQSSHERSVYFPIDDYVLRGCQELGLITSPREPITKPEHTIHTLAEDQKDLDPAVNKMVNEKFWELLEDKPNALNEWNNEVKDYALDAREYNTNSMDKLNFTGDEIKSIILKGNAMRDELKAYIDKLRQPIAEPESLVEAKKKYLACPSESCNFCTCESDYIRELEAHYCKEGK